MDQRAHGGGAAAEFDCGWRDCGCGERGGVFAADSVVVLILAVGGGGGDAGDVSAGDVQRVWIGVGVQADAFEGSCAGVYFGDAAVSVAEVAGGAHDGDAAMRGVFEACGDGDICVQRGDVGGD